jgi:hypothetical protein
VSPQKPYPLNQDRSLSKAGIHNRLFSQETLCRNLYKDNVVANSIKAFTLLLTAPYSLYCGSNFDFASLLRILLNKIFPSDGLDEENRVSCLQIFAAIILSF